MDALAPERMRYIRRSGSYYRNLVNFYRYVIPESQRVLEIGCGNGYLLDKVKPSFGVGIDLSEKMTALARERYPRLHFYQMDVEDLQLTETFDYVIISDTLGYLEDIQLAFQQIKKVLTPETRVVINYHHFSWTPLLNLAEFLRLKMPQPLLNWLTKHDVKGLMEIEGYDMIRSGRRLLLPVYIPLLSWFINKYVAYLLFFNLFCLTGYMIARHPSPGKEKPEELSVSVVIPARNEKGNIEDAVKRIPDMGRHTEIIFVEGNSTDETPVEIERVCREYGNLRDIKSFTQTGRGKGDAVRLGFDKATGDILMILDADLTVPPEDLTKFYEAIASGKGEYVQGSRLVYPLEKQAMRFLNLMGNRFFSVMFTWLLGQRIKDTLCGTKVLKKKNYEKLIANRSYFGDFDPFGDFDLIFGASKLNLKMVEIPIRYQARQYGETNISRFKHGWLLIRMVVYAMNKIKFLS